MGRQHDRHGAVIRRVRKLVLERDNYACRACGARPGAPNLEVHHIKPLSKGGSRSPRNCKTLCRKCHIKLHDTPLAAARREWKAYSHGL